MATAEPVDLAKHGSIPLDCVLCPKKPSFSDVSHLLTHISSKSHLSHRFRTEIRADKERGARETLAQFDDWYEKYGIQKLLAHRLASKDSKKPTRRARAGVAKHDARPTPKRNKTIGSELRDFPQTAHLADWTNVPTDGLPRVAGQHLVLGSPGSLGDKYETWSSEAGIPGNILAPEGASDIAAEEDNDRSKLKGARWPGMSVFDSATEAQKKKRNQRKDESVLKQMERTSAEVEPMEIVWSEDGELQRMRDIYATPSIDGSPEPSVIPGGNQRMKEPHHDTTMATPRQTRASTRKSRTRGDSKAMDNNSAGGPHRGQNGNQDGHMLAFAHDAGDSYNIFRDPPAPSPDSAESPAEGGRSVMAPDYLAGPVFDRNNSFEHGRRPALQPMDSNMPIQSTAPTSLKPAAFDYFHGVNPHMSPFFHHHTMGSNTLNPLSIQRRTGYPFNPFSTQGFAEDVLSSSSAFNQLDTANPMGFNSFPTSSDNDPYSSSATAHQDTPEYDV